MHYKQLKRQNKVNSELREHYEALYHVAVKELKFERLQIDFRKATLDEVESLVDKVPPAYIKAIIKNAEDRAVLDKLIHNHLIG